MKSFLRQVVYAALPLGEGIILEAAEALGISAIGIERHPAYYQMSRSAIPKLAALAVHQSGKHLPSLSGEQLTLW